MSVLYIKGYVDSPEMSGHRYTTKSHKTRDKETDEKPLGENTPLGKDGCKNQTVVGVYVPARG